MAVSFLKSVDGIDYYELKKSKITAEIMTYGGRITRLIVPDRNGNPVDVLAGYPDPQGYFADKNSYFGAIVGRVAYRIKNGVFSLNGKEYVLSKNSGNNHLHGGLVGFSDRVWTAKTDGDSLILTYLSPDGEEGYPGDLKATVVYTVTEDGLKIVFDAETDAETLYCPTSHAYFNLNGDFTSVLDHLVTINADRYIEMDEELVPTGRILPTAGTPFDFSTERTIGECLPNENPMIRIGGKQGYDLPFILNGTGKAATAYGKESGILMTVYTDASRLQFYTGNFLDGLVGKKVYDFQSAFCMETQGYRGAANTPTVPGVVLHPGTKYRTGTEYRFGTR